MYCPGKSQKVPFLIFLRVNFSAKGLNQTMEELLLAHKRTAEHLGNTCDPHVPAKCSICDGQ